MPATPDDLFAFLGQLGIHTSTATHPPLYTVEESRRLRGTIPGGHVKNLFLKDKKESVFLVVALENTAIDLKTLHHRLGSGRLSFGSRDLLRELLGVEPGAVTPFAALNDREAENSPRVSIVLDATMMAQKVLNCHPLVNTMTTTIARDDLVKFLVATGHEPTILAVADGVRDLVPSLEPANVPVSTG